MPWLVHRGIWAESKLCWKRDVERRNLLLLKGFMLFKVVFGLMLFNLWRLCIATEPGRNISFQEKQIISQINLNSHSRQCLDDLTLVLPQNTQCNKKTTNVTLLKSAWYSFVNSKFPSLWKENSICILPAPWDTAEGQTGQDRGPWAKMMLIIRQTNISLPSQSWTLRTTDLGVVYSTLVQCWIFHCCDKNICVWLSPTSFSYCFYPPSEEARPRIWWTNVLRKE